jgi:transposase InsO family protein
MNIRLHKNARTTPAIRREIQAQPASISNRALAEQYRIHYHTVAKWRKREDVEDASHQPHTLHTTLTPAQEKIVLALRESLLLPLDDLLAVTREFINPDVSRSGINRLLKRFSMPSLKALQAAQQASEQHPPKRFKDYEPGYVHVDVKYLPQMPDEDRRRYLFAAIDRATRWVYIEILDDKSAASAQGFFQRLIDKTPFVIRTVLTDNGKEFTDRFCATGEREPTGQHLFDQVCHTHDIEHRLIKAKHPQTNGMIERFNGRIADVLATTRFDSSQSLAKTLENYVQVYNQHIPQKALGHIAPLQAMKNWYSKQPELFHKPLDNLTELDNYKLKRLIEI